MNPEQIPSTESALQKVLITEVPITHEDERRAIIEFYDRREGEPKFANQKVMWIRESKDDLGMKLGNHYHEDWELFYLADGEIDELVLQDIATSEKLVEHNIKAGTRILLPPNVAHLLVFKKPSLLIASNENPFNADNLKPFNLSSE